MKKSILVDERQDQYTPFFGDDFAQIASDAADDVADLKLPVFDLVADLRGTSYAAALPALVPSSIKAFHDGFVNAGASSAGILKYSEAILTRLSRDVPELANFPDLRRKLQSKLVDIAYEVSSIDSEIEQSLDGDSLWSHYLSLHPFHLGLHATMRQAYLAIYGAFENFVVRSVSSFAGNARVRAGDATFKEVLRSNFGSVADTAWYTTELNAARLVRHSLIHAGGRVTADLKKVRIPVIAHEEQLHIFPEHLKALYSCVSTAALEFIRAPAFRRHPSTEIG